MTTIKAHFDGKTFVPDEPVTALQPGDRVEVFPSAEERSADVETLWRWLDEEVIPSSADLPRDLAHQHDHYLYGTPKKPE